MKKGETPTSAHDLFVAVAWCACINLFATHTNALLRALRVYCVLFSTFTSRHTREARVHTTAKQRNSQNKFSLACNDVDMYRYLYGE